MSDMRKIMNLCEGERAIWDLDADGTKNAMSHFWDAKPMRRGHEREPFNYVRTPQDDGMGDSAGGHSSLEDRQKAQAEAQRKVELRRMAREILMKNGIDPKDLDLDVMFKEGAEVNEDASIPLLYGAVAAGGMLGPMLAKAVMNYFRRAGDQANEADVQKIVQQTMDQEAAKPRA